MVSNKHVCLGILVVMMFLPLASAINNETINYDCPQIVCVDTDFTIWAKFYYNDTLLTTADITVNDSTTTYNLTYSEIYERHEATFNSNASEVWNITINATNDTLTPTVRDSTITSLDCINLTIKIWEEVEYDIFASDDTYVIKVKNYDKELNDPYINNFAYIIAMNNDVIVDVDNETCNFGFGVGQKASEFMNLDFFIGNSLTNQFIEDYGSYIGCDHYWFNAEYVNGTAIIPVPYAGNYTLWLVDGILSYKNMYSPPRITKSDQFLFFGSLIIPTKVDTTAEYYITHDEISFWGSFMDSNYIWMITLIPIFLFIGLNYIGVSMQITLGTTLLWIIIWTLLRML